MFSRVTLLLITVFWLSMNFLLWRSEFGGGNHVGAKVPVEVVWQKILTAPDPSRLQILHHGKELGYCDWSTVIGEELSPEKMLNEGVALEQSTHKMNGYRIDFDGKVSLSGAPNRLGIKVNATFNPKREWQEFSARFNLRPDTWVLYSKAAEQSLHLRLEGGDESYDHVYKFADLQNPRFLVQEFQLPVPPQFFDALEGSPSGRSTAKLSPGIVWEARNDWVTIGHTAVRAYRLQARILDRFMIVITVSEVGEILRVELPDEWNLVNDQFSDL